MAPLPHRRIFRYRSPMTRSGYFIRLLISVAIDVFDLTVGRALFMVPWEEGVGALILFLLWGWPGLLYLGELAEPTEQFDAFLPGATLIALSIGLKKGFLFPGKSTTTVPARKP